MKTPRKRKSPVRGRSSRPYSKRRIQDAEDLWLDWFEMLLREVTAAMIGDGEDADILKADGAGIAAKAREITDAALAEYEHRWMRVT